MSDTIKVYFPEEQPATVAVLVESVWPEGFTLHGIFPDVNGAVNAVPHTNCDHKETYIELLPVGVILTANPERLDFKINSIVSGALAGYDLQGNLKNEYK